jgi:sigma-B regulation protein RsbU (phosphoserine phosphatase)
MSCAGDVSGKGVPAALFMASTRTLLRAVAMQGSSAAECIRQVNNVLANQSDGHMFVTLFYGILNARNGELDFCNGGHHPPCVFSPGGSLRSAPRAGGLLVGLFEGAKYAGGSMLLSPGDALLFYTDGVTEATDVSGTMFENDRVKQMLRTTAHAPVDQIVKGLMGEVRAFQGSAPQRDDITVLAVRYLGPS